MFKFLGVIKIACLFIILHSNYALCFFMYIKGSLANCYDSLYISAAHIIFFCRAQIFFFHRPRSESIFQFACLFESIKDDKSGTNIYLECSTKKNDNINSMEMPMQGSINLWGFRSCRSWSDRTQSLFLAGSRFGFWKVGYAYCIRP